MTNVTFRIVLILMFILLFNIRANSQTWKELNDSTRFYLDKKDFPTAMKWAELTLQQAEKEFGKADTHYAYSLYDIAIIYDELTDDKKAIELGKEALAIYRAAIKGDNSETAKVTISLALWYQQMNDFDNAEIFYKESLEIHKNSNDMDSLLVARIFDHLGSLYNNQQKLDKTAEMRKEALKMYRLIYPGDHPELEIGIANMAFINYQMGKLYEAEALYKEALEMARRLYPGDHPDLAISIGNMAGLYMQIGKRDEAEPLYKEDLEMKRRLYKGDHPYIVSGMNNLAYYYDAVDRYSEAEPLFREALEMCRRLFKDDHPYLPMSTYNLGHIYAELGRYSEAEPLYVESMEMSRRLYKSDHPDLARSISNLGYFYYYSIGNYKKAEPLLKEAVEMYRHIYNGDHPDLAGCIASLAAFYSDVGKSTDVEILSKEAFEMNRRIFKGDHFSLAFGMSNLATVYSDNGKLIEADSLYIESVAMGRRINRNNNSELAKLISNMAGFYSNTGRYAEAEPLLKEALEINRGIFISNHPILEKSIRCLADLYYVTGRYTEAEPLYQEALGMSRQLFQDDHPELANTIGSVTQLYLNQDKIDEALPLYIEMMGIYTNLLNNYLPSLSEKEKKQFWNTVSSRFEGFNSYASSMSKEYPSITRNMYDYQLYTKAMLLNSSSRIKSRIMNSSDSALVAQLKKWSDKKEFLLTLYKMTNDELKKKNFDIDSIENTANELEKQISLRSEEFKQSYEHKKVTWKSIQTLLNPDEAAVEVIRFRKLKSWQFQDSVCYAFLIVNDKTEEQPELIVIEDGLVLEHEYYQDYREQIKGKNQDTLSFRRYWAKLFDRLKGFKKIYFSADGIYNKVNPATFLMPDGKYLFERQDIQLVNSTRDLLMGYYQKKDESNIYNNAVLVGNPNFGLSEEEVREVSKKIRGDYEDEKSYDLLASTRGLFLSKLPNTEKEIKDIEQLFRDKKWVVKTYLGDMAVKGVVTSASSPRVLHIATHGLFLEDVKRGGKEIFGFEEQKLVENPLLRSGLFFSGAENLIKSEGESYIEKDNGLLTAYEAMNLDLDKTELVVLSACETGLGEVQNGEGVFGLRRAFQQAGARTVIMSLWAVSDQATQELMSQFYTNWVSGISKRDAFRNAQQEIKNKYPEPYYWGGFIMVGE